MYATPPVLLTRLNLYFYPYYMALSRTLSTSIKKPDPNAPPVVKAVKTMSASDLKLRANGFSTRVIESKRTARLEEEAVVLEVMITSPKPPVSTAVALMPKAAPKPQQNLPKVVVKVPEETNAEDTDPNDEHVHVVDGVEVNKVRILAGVKKSSLRRLNTMFGQRSDAIIDLLEFGDQDGALGLISKSILQTLVDILPVIERGIRKTKGTRGVYQLNQTISQMREMCSDIQAYKDKSMLGATIVERHIRPSYLDIAVQITAAFAELEASSRPKMSKEDFDVYREDGLNQMKRNLADYIKHQYEEVSEGIVKSLT